MTDFNRKEHWEKIYGTKSLQEVSWYQPIPNTSLDMVKLFDLSKNAKIIDVGGGDSFLVDHLLNSHRHSMHGIYVFGVRGESTYMFLFCTYCLALCYTGGHRTSNSGRHRVR